jgi:hypothetical protein
MAVAYVQEFEVGDRSTENNDFVADKIGDAPFDGLIVHTAGFDDEAGVVGSWTFGRRASTPSGSSPTTCRRVPDPIAFTPPGRGWLP